MTNQGMATTQIFCSSHTLAGIGIAITLGLVAYARSDAATVADDPDGMSWHGVGHQPDANMDWDVELVVGEQLGTISFPTLNCRGQLIRQPDRDGKLILDEYITDNPDGTCITHGTITISRAVQESDVTWFYDTGLEAAHGILATSQQR